MTQSTNHSRTLSKLRREHEAARLQLEIRQFQAASGLPLLESWGDVVDRREAQFDESTGAPCGSFALASLDDRRDGRFRPFYETELDLARIRGSARQLSCHTAVTVGALDSLANYVLAGGFTFTAHSEFDQPRLITAVQRVIDEFLDENDFPGGLDRELHHRSREDGEAFVVLAPQENGKIKARVLEPEQVVEPANARAIEDWLDISQQSDWSWSFGIQTPVDSCDEPLGYHVIFDSAGRDWDYLPVERVQHIKRNSPRNAKRGLSDFHVIQGDLEREAKLRRNTVEGAALQAAIAWILQAPPGATAGQMQGLVGPDALKGSRPVVSGSSHAALNYPPGTILKPSAGLEYKPGPMGSERNPNFVLVGQYVLRSIGVRWNMPEYLISGDASNANYASTLVSESPFVKAREADQQFYRRHWYCLIWKVLRQAWVNGRFSRLGVSWDSLEEIIDVKVDVPAVATRDPLRLAQTQEAQIRIGILSRRTAAAQAGLDYDLEVRQGASGDGAPEENAESSPTPPQEEGIVV